MWNKSGRMGTRMEFNFQEYRTPCYIINKKQFLDNLMAIQESFRTDWGENILIGYSVKTNHMPKLLEIAQEEGMVAEVVSDDEYDYAVHKGYSQNNIIFNGPQKSEQRLLDALKNGSIVNVDTLDEIDVICRNQEQLNNCRLRLGIRINFDLEKICPGETTAGNEGSRFGVCLENGDFERALDKLAEFNIKLEGLHLHYSTKTRSLKVFETLTEMACKICQKYNLIENIKFVDIGGGFFGGRILDGKPTMSEYSKKITGILKQAFEPDSVQLVLEPGASLIATAVEYLSKVINVRSVRGIKYITTDGSLQHINPFFVSRLPDYKLYTSGKKQILTQIVCGATCMENDRIVKLDRKQELSVGDFIQIYNVGAYTMGFNCCFINTPPYVYLKEHEKTVLLRDKENKLFSDI